MNTQQKCPHCGSQSEEIGRHAKSVDLSEISFRCLNKSCGSGFTGVLTLTRSGVAGAQNFNAPARPAGSAGATVTDC